MKRLFILLMLVVASVTFLNAQNNRCPRQNCKAKCNKECFVDRNNDGVCDKCVNNACQKGCFNMKQDNRNCGRFNKAQCNRARNCNQNQCFSNNDRRFQRRCPYNR